MHEIEIPSSLRTAFVFSVMSLGVAAFGVALGSAKLIALGAAFFVGGVATAWDRRAKLGVSRYGLWYFRWGRTVFPWSDFHGWRLVRHGSATFLQLVPKRPEEIITRFSRWARFDKRFEAKFGQPPFSIPLAQFPPQINEVLAWLRDNVPECSGTFDEPQVAPDIRGPQH
jgi:hypothetical protein